MGDGGGKDSNVVGVGEEFNVGDEREAVDERIVSNDKEERG